MLASAAQDLEEGRSQPLVTAVHNQYRCCAYSPSQERRPRVLLEQIDPADIAAQRVERAMPADLGHLEHRRPEARLHRRQAPSRQPQGKERVGRAWQFSARAFTKQNHRDRSQQNAQIE